MATVNMFGGLFAEDDEDGAGRPTTTTTVGKGGRRITTTTTSSGAGMPGMSFGTSALSHQSPAAATMVVGGGNQSSGTGRPTSSTVGSDGRRRTVRTHDFRQQQAGGESAGAMADRLDGVRGMEEIQGLFREMDDDDDAHAPDAVPQTRASDRASDKNKTCLLVVGVVGAVVVVVGVIIAVVITVVIK